MKDPKDWHILRAAGWSAIGFGVLKAFGYSWDTNTLFYVGQAFGLAEAARWFFDGIYYDVVGRRIQLTLDAQQLLRDLQSLGGAQPSTAPQKQTDGFMPVNRSQMSPAMVTNQQAVEMPKLNMQQHFFTCVLRSYDLDPIKQSKVNLSETLWVEQRKMFTQKPFARMKHRAADIGAFRRKDGRKNSEFVVGDRKVLEWLSHGNSLPENTPALTL